MPIQIITPRKHVEAVSYHLHYSHKDAPGCGYSFDCDEAGNPTSTNPASIKNLAMCRKSTDYVFTGISTYTNRYTEAATARCYCGAVVSLDDPLDNDCVCGKCYNMSGQEVTPNYGRAECTADGWAFDEDDY